MIRVPPTVMRIYEEMEYLKERMLAFERIAVQMIADGGEEMAKYREKVAHIDVTENPIYRAKLAGKEAALAGAPQNAPTEGYNVLMRQAWLTGYSEGKLEGRKAG